MCPNAHGSSGRTPLSMLCPQCGVETAASAGRCPACQATLAPRSPKPVAAATMTPPPPTDAPTLLAADGETLLAIPSGEGETLLGTPSGDAETMMGTGPPREPRPGLGASGAGDLTLGPAGTGDDQTIGPGFPPRGTQSTEKLVAPGEPFGTRYHIIRILGSGGMGVVYQAWDAELGVTVALKVIRPEVTSDPYTAREVERRFKRELLLAREVTHNNVVRIHDLGEVKGIKYITMSYVDGRDLATILNDEKRLTVPRALQIVRGVVSGLRAAHEAGVVHRDLKPANIMIDAHDEARIMDFGIARSTSHATVDEAGEADPTGKLAELRRQAAVLSNQTLEGAIVGTVEYMAPEQAKGKPVDQRVDIYALGLIVYDMLGGLGRGSRTESAIDELTARMQHPPPPIREINPDVPEALAKVIARCLEPEADARYATTKELEADLQQLDSEGNLLPVLRRVTSRQLAVAALLVLSLLGVTWWLSRTPPPEVLPPPTSVLIADFENRTGDPEFQDSLEQGLEMAVETASFINIYKRDTARKLADQLKLGTRVDENAARLISTREGINVVLAGAIERKRSGYAVSVKAIDPATAKLLGTSTKSAGSKAEVLKAIGSLASDVRALLGDKTPESKKLAGAETVTTASLEALADYSRAQDFLYNSKDEQAIEYYKRAIAEDPNLGRAYSGWAISAENLGRHQESAEAWKKALSLVDRMTDREKYRTLGLYYVRPARNYKMAIESFSTLVELYPNDRGGHVNLALAYFYTRNFPKALEEGRRSVEGAPRDLMNRTNYALYAMYAADFATAAAEAKAVIKQDPAFYRAYLPLAMAALATSDFDGARSAYEAMAKSGAPGASVATLGLADMALYQGRFRDAEVLLRAGIVEDERQQNTVGVAAKHTALSEAYLGQGKKAPAVSAAERAMKLLGRDITAVPAARALIDAGKPEAARALAAQLGDQLQPESRAYGKVLEGYLALHEGRRVVASESLLTAQKLVDLWWARLDLGVAYTQAEHHAEALGELDRAYKRRGEATAILLDDLPTFRYVGPLVYWKARAQEGSGQRAAAMENYKAYLAIRSSAPGDPLVADARRRVGTP
jgi:serine/threonine protein kinase/tetratricopeptide (TPR) repeat protein